MTLTGTGGTGKTRLAIKAVEGLEKKFTDGIFFVNLAPLSDADMVAKAIADALELYKVDEDNLKRVLKDKKCLLILDNFEHVISAALLVDDLLKSAPDLHILVTSREALDLVGESEYSVQPLHLPTEELLETLATNEAIQLFVHRAQAVKQKFELTEDNAQAVCEICTRLDGLPLAIELAAGQMRTLNPQTILKRMENRLDHIKSSARNLADRHKTIRDSIEWSYDLLDDAEKTLFARLSVFPWWAAYRCD